MKTISTKQIIVIMLLHGYGLGHRSGHIAATAGNDIWENLTLNVIYVKFMFHKTEE